MENQLIISDADKNILLYLLNKYLPCTEAWAYGSRVTGTARPASDLDLVVFANKEQSLQVGDLREAFEESDLTFRVDLFVWDSVPESFKVNIEKEHVVLCDTVNEALQEHVLRYGKTINKLETKWLTYSLEDVADELTVGFVGSMASEYVEDGVPFLRSLNIIPFGIELSGIKFITQSFHNKLRKSSLQPGDVVIVRTGKPGTAAVIPDSLTDANCSDLVIVRCGKKIRPHFLCAWINYLGMQHVASHLVGAVQQHFNVSSAKTMQIALPSNQEQAALENVARAYTNRIQLLRETNATLEAMAQALFKSWFVDFDPVHAKAEGRTPEGMDAETAALFPARFEESELGMVPKGWEITTIGAAFHLTMGQSPPGDTYNDIGNGLPFFQGRTDFGIRYPENRKYCSAPSRVANADDTLISVRAPVGDLNTAWENCCIGRGVAAARHKSVNASFTYYLLKSIQNQISAFDDSGTVFGSITKKQFEGLNFLSPPENLIHAFEKHVHVFDKIIRNNTEKSRTLTAIRDTLLPRLISGKLRLSEFTTLDSESSV